MPASPIQHWELSEASGRTGVPRLAPLLLMLRTEWVQLGDAAGRGSLGSNLDLGWRRPGYQSQPQLRHQGV